MLYNLINGNIPDVKSMRRCIEEIGLQNIILIADKGFHSEQNLDELIKHNLQYIIPLKRTCSAIDYKPFQNNEFEKTMKYFTYQNMIIWYHEYDFFGKKYVTFLNEQLRTQERTDFLIRRDEKIQKNENCEGEDPDKKFLDKKHTFGTLTLTYNIKEEKTPKEIFEIYKQRNEIESMFDSYKNFLEADKTYMQDRYVLDGWLFVNFLAMISYHKLFDRLRQAKLLRKISPKDVIAVARGIYQNRVQWNKTWVLSEISQKNKKMFKILNICTLT